MQESVATGTNTTYFSLSTEQPAPAPHQNTRVAADLSR